MKLFESPDNVLRGQLAMDTDATAVYTRSALERLRHHVSGAIERGEAEAIEAVDADQLEL